MVLPNFIIIGAPRAGTTALTRYLSAHPQILMSARKELHFFDSHYERGLDWYARQFAVGVGKLAVGEATPTYMYKEEAIARMARALPEAKLVAILREPVDRAYSHYWLIRARGWEPLEFVAAIKPGHGRRPYLEEGRYLKYLRQVCRYYAREALHVVILEDLRDAPVPFYASLCRFLGVDDTFVPRTLGRPVHQYAEFRSLLLFKISHKLPPGPGRFVDRFNARHPSYPPLDPGLRQALREQFAADNAALAEWLGRDLSFWNNATP